MLKKFFLFLLIINVLFISSFLYVNAAEDNETDYSLGGGASDLIVGQEEEGGIKWGKIVTTAFGIEPGESQLDLPTSIGMFIAGLLTFIGALFLLLIIYGGVLWMTAGGNEDKVKKGQKYIINSVIGITIVLSANVLIVLILNFIIPLE